MKQFFTAIFAFLYLIISCGFTMNIHYCMGKELGCSVFHSNKNNCSTCGMPKSNSKGCCKDEIKTIKLSSDQKTTDNVWVKNLQLTSVARLLNADEISFASPSEYDKLNNLSPPYWRNIPVFIYDCNFRI